jgi:ankyrin repeat protein
MNDDFQKFYNAAVFGFQDQVKALLQRVPTLVRAADKYGFTALHGVVGEDRPAMAEFLIQNGADVHAANDLGMPPLHIAQQAAMVEILVRHGAKLDARSKQGWTPLHVQAQEGEDTGSMEVIEALLQAGADPNLRDGTGRTPLDYALLREEEEKVALLRSHGAGENG